MDSLKNNLTSFAERLVRMSREIGEIRSFVNENEVPEYVTHRVDLLGLSDEIDSLKYNLIALTDGRPKPVEFRDQCDWLECFERGKTHIASIARIEMSKEDLVTVRDWINETLIWHEHKR